jgi:hypothetical protein
MLVVAIYRTQRARGTSERKGVGAFSVQRHIHGPDAQHDGVEVEAVEQAFVEGSPQLFVAEQTGVMLAKIFAGRDQEAAA